MYVVLHNDTSMYSITYYKILFLFVRWGTPFPNEQRNNSMTLINIMFSLYYIYTYIVDIIPT